MNWWRRNKGINTETKNKMEAPEGVWYKCPSCKKTFSLKQHKDLNYTCPECDFHERVGSKIYFDIFVDEQQYEILFSDLKPKDVLHFVDLKSYANRLIDETEKTNLDEAIQCAVGISNGKNRLIAAMDFSFIGGSMGSVVGARIAKSIDYCILNSIPLIIISKSGGARMMESAFSLMQMAKIAAKLTQLSEAKIPFISILTDPTTGGVSASFAMLGDLNISEPKALIGFAGPRVIEETIKEKIPVGAQQSEALLENGFLDCIVHRKEIKQKVNTLLEMMGF